MPRYLAELCARIASRSNQCAGASSRAADKCGRSAANRRDKMKRSSRARPASPTRGASRCSSVSAASTLSAARNQTKRVASMMASCIGRSGKSPARLLLGLVLAANLVGADWHDGSGPWVIATKGEPWPSPNSRLLHNDYYYLQPDSFSFQVTFPSLFVILPFTYSFSK